MSGRLISEEGGSLLRDVSTFEGFSEDILRGTLERLGSWVDIIMSVSESRVSGSSIFAGESAETVSCDSAFRGETWRL